MVSHADVGSVDAQNLPAYDDLPILESIGVRHTWGLLPAGLGTLGLLSPAETSRAAHAVRTGESIPLNLRTDAFDPPLFGRRAVAHTISESARNIFEDDLSEFNPQSTSQWDGFLHIRAREFGFYGGHTEHAAAGDAVGIHHFAAAGIVGRGVLLDVARHRLRTGRAWDPLSGDMVGVEELQEILEHQRTTLETGDILCLRFGWLDAYRRVNGAGGDTSSIDERFSGLSADDDVVRFLWEHRVAAVGADNPAVESAPGDPRIGSLHRKLIPGLGMPFAELLDLELLAERCEEIGAHDFFFTAAPLNLPGGASSTANAIAVL